MKKGIFILLASVGLAAGSCSKDSKDCDPHDQESACYAGLPGEHKFLLIEEKRNGKTELAFEYDDLNRVVAYSIYPREAGEIESKQLTYNPDNQLMTVEHSSGGQYLYREEYTYGPAGTPTSAVWKYDDATVSIQYGYTSNTVTETAINEDGEIIGLNTYSFDNKGNPSKTVLTTGSITLSTQEFGDYDSRPYRYTNYPWSWKLKSLNNARAYKLTATPPGASPIIIDEKWEFNYNDAGYPVEAKVYDRISNDLVETRTFTYKSAR